MINIQVNGILRWPNKHKKFCNCRGDNLQKGDFWTKEVLAQVTAPLKNGYQVILSPSSSERQVSYFKARFVMGYPIQCHLFMCRNVQGSCTRFHMAGSPLCFSRWEQGNWTHPVQHLCAASGPLYFNCQVDTESVHMSPSIWHHLTCTMLLSWV